MLVASEVPVTVVGWFRDYATGQGTTWQRVGTTLVVNPTILPNGRAMRIGGATRGINQVTRQILGYREQLSSSESSFILSATVQ